MAKGLSYLHARGIFHRDLTSKNVLVRRGRGDGRVLNAIIADFGLAAEIPDPTERRRLPQVGSPYWMSPECLRGEFYDEKADIFSFGIILCELIGRLEADPDILPRTENFGVDYVAFSTECADCPPEFLKLAFTCVRIDPEARPSAKELIRELDVLLESQRRVEAREHFEGKIRSSSSAVARKRDTPSEKARLHSIALSVGREMSLRDPHYRPALGGNPFATLPRLREGRKIMGSSRDLFSSCFELPSPARATTPTSNATFKGDAEFNARDFASALNRGLEKKSAEKRPSVSLPSSPTRRHSLSHDVVQEEEEVEEAKVKATPKAASSRFEEHLFQGRVQLLKKLYSGGTWMTQDDSAVMHQPPHSLKRRGSCESGFYSVTGVANDDMFLESGLSSTRSLGSSLLTVSDLEEDLRAASAFLSNQRTSSVFTADSTDDLASLALDEELRLSTDTNDNKGYEKDIRDIVEYFEASCNTSRPLRRKSHVLQAAKQLEDKQKELVLSRSPKIESLIKRVVEKESRDRMRSKGFVMQASNSSRLQVCDGIVSSKLRLFDETKRNSVSTKGLNVKSKMAIFE